jgi:hypothetical protein
MNSCAPSKKFTNGSCLTVDELVLIAEEYNKKYNDKINISSDKKYLLTEIAARMKRRFSCSEQECWINTSLIKNMNNDEISQNTMRPVGPKKQYEWLSTSNINDVMYQYEFKYPEFKFLGAVPFDFEEVQYYGISDIIFSKLSIFGMVINLDNHTMSGSHWVALYCDLKHYKIYYFDSFGKKPGDKVTKFIKKILTYMCNTKYGTNISQKQCITKILSSDDANEFDVRFNRKQHQFKNSECGVYSMNFIIRLLNNETFDNIVDNVTDDVTMNACREKYFRNVKF